MDDDEYDIYSDIKGTEPSPSIVQAPERTVPIQSPQLVAVQTPSSSLPLSTATQQPQSQPTNAPNPKSIPTPSTTQTNTPNQTQTSSVSRQSNDNPSTPSLPHHQKQQTQPPNRVVSSKPAHIPEYQSKTTNGSKTNMQGPRGVVSAVAPSQALNDAPDTISQGEDKRQLSKDESASSTPSTKVVCISGLTWYTTDRDIKTLLESYGTVRDMNFSVEKSNGKSNGVVYVELSTSAEITTLLEKLNDTKFQGNVIQVKQAHPSKLVPLQYPPSNSSGGNNKRSNGKRTDYQSSTQSNGNQHQQNSTSQPPSYQQGNPPSKAPPILGSSIPNPMMPTPFAQMPGFPTQVVSPMYGNPFLVMQPQMFAPMAMGGHFLYPGMDGTHPAMMSEMRSMEKRRNDSGMDYRDDRPTPMTNSDNRQPNRNRSPPREQRTESSSPPRKKPANPNYQNQSYQQPPVQREKERDDPRYFNTRPRGGSNPNPRHMGPTNGTGNFNSNRR